MSAKNSKVKVIPLDCLSMVKPLTGRTFIGIDEDLTAAWERHNAVWDGKGICLSGARGETVCFQLVILRPDNSSISSARLSLDMPFVEKPKFWRSWAICCLPELAVALNEDESFDIPSRNPLELNLAPEQKDFIASSIGIEFKIPLDSYGNLSGKVTIKADSGMEPASIPISLHVYDFRLPEKPRFTIEMNSYGDWTRWLDNNPATYLGIHRLMREHRCVFTQVPYQQPGNILCPYLSPEIDLSGDEVKIDWSYFDKNLACLFDGTAFDDGIPLHHFILPMAYNTPVRFSLYEKDPEKYIRLQIEIRRQFFQHFLEKGWHKTIFQEFHNENIENGADTSPWYLDEPRTAEDMLGHELFLEIFEKSVPKRNDKVKLHYRIDISWWQRLGEVFDQFAPRFDDWIVSRDPNFLNNESAAMFRNLADSKQGLFMEYGETAGFCKNGEYAVNWSHFADYLRRCWFLGTDGFEQWIIDMWATPPGEKKMTAAKALTYASAGGMRDYIWPGNAFGQMEALASIRLKALRECMNLFDYASLVIDKYPGKLGEINSLLQKMDTRSSADHHRLKKIFAQWLA